MHWYYEPEPPEIYNGEVVYHQELPPPGTVVGGDSGGKAPTTRVINGVTYQWDSSANQWVVATGLPTEAGKVPLQQPASYIDIGGTRYFLDADGNVIDQRDLSLSGGGAAGPAPRRRSSTRAQTGP